MEHLKNDGISLRISVIKLLFMLQKKIFKQLGSVFKEENLTITEMMILFLLRNQNYKVTDLAHELGIPSSTLTGLIDRMVQKGLVDRYRSKKDRRVVIITLGKDFSKKKAEINSKLKQYVKKIDGQLSEEWWRNFKSELLKLEKVLDSKGAGLDD
ncbi:MAG: hypothetical protein PWQ82_1688 [Thermosediminibacterales bacterium]|nr:hypothetical protein [Thermosediminibacterales bacterium]MDK2836669.1 hypothetical protein [Thermosediminibacterales bacterium]